MKDKDIVKKAYKKLKADVYYDKTMSLLRNAIVDFESSYSDEELEKEFEKIYNWLQNKDIFLKETEDIIAEIDIISLPKKLENKFETGFVISNDESKENKITDLQYYIDIPVEGHILGALWVMLVGCWIDSKLYENLYANRISKYIVKNNYKYTYSPYLFEPYFVQYESWRDKGLACAESIIDRKDNVIIITLDLQRYFYSLDVNECVMQCIWNEAISLGQIKDVEVCLLLNNFITRVVEKYAAKFGDDFEGRRILPIGFLPSNIISNWCLHKFDEAILEGVNPAYYGRYVDDILIVDAVNDKSTICQQAEKGNLSIKNVIDLYFARCTKWCDICKGGESICNQSFKFAEVRYVDNEKEKTTVDYIVNAAFNPSDDDKSILKFNIDKTKVFYFKWQESVALLTCFKEKIAKSKSEFRHMPDAQFFRKDDYTDIYALMNEAGLNKLRGVQNIDVDRFELSKYIGKYLKICFMINENKVSKFEKDILKILNYRIILQSYTLWEKILEIFAIKENYVQLEKLCDKIFDAIQSVEYIGKEKNAKTEDVQLRLYEVLLASLCRCFALVWKGKRRDIQIVLCKKLLEKIKKYSYEHIENIIAGYCYTRMVDKMVMPIPFDMLDITEINCGINVNLTCFNDTIKLIKPRWDSQYKYYPYLLSMCEFCMVGNLEFIRSYDGVLGDFEGDYIDKYYHANYNKSGSKKTKIKHIINKDDLIIRYFPVGNGRKNKLKIAIANVVLKHRDFENVIIDGQERSYDRYKNLSRIVNDAIDNCADMLVMPEAYLPYEWLPILAQTCKKEQIAIVTGIEHLKYDDKIWNFTAVMLPYEKNGHKDAEIFFHLKKHYAPSEVESILGYGLSYVEGNTYELYKWNNCYFPVYCCYELTSIKDRAIFQSLADLVVAVEWNRDVKYYSNIAESLSRDMHCYFVQVNSANYGDSRIVKPTKSVEKDLIRTKGGINSSVLIDSIDIKKLRDFQIMRNNLQKKDGSYKLTPPNLNRNIIMKKIKGEEIYFDE